MDSSIALGDLRDQLSPALSRLLQGHLERLPLPEQAAALMTRWVERHGAALPESSFLNLLYLAASSEALFLGLMRHPEQLPIIGSQVRAGTMGREDLEAGLARLLLTRRWGSPAEALAAFRTLQTTRILLQDLLGVLDFEEVTAELTALADVLIGKAFALTYQPLRETLGLPLWVTEGGRALPCDLTVFALGKLGAGELNYVSDVDLVFFYRAEGTTDRGHPNASFFGAWAQAATALLSRSTADGPCLKVDTALRPRGRDGELTLSYDAALAYYREWADLWERQAWIRGRPCAGDVEGGAVFLAQMSQIVYQPYSFSGIAEQNLRMREKSLARLRRLGELERDVKEGPGGIRDAEFAVQALQMAHGQTDRWVREGHTLLALSKLRQKGILTTRKASALASGYVFLRRVEHWAQLQHMRQTHRLPGGEEEWAALARFLHEASAEEARSRVAAHRQALGTLFRRTLEELGEGDGGPSGIVQLTSEEGMLEVLRQARMPDPDRALPHLASVYRSLAPMLDRPSRRQHFRRIHYSLAREFESAPEPYEGLCALRNLVASLAAESGAVAALLDRPRLPRLIFRLVSLSAPLLLDLQRWPFLLDLVRYEAMRDLERRLEPPGGGAPSADALRRWQKEVLFLAGSREIVMGESLAFSHGVYTRLAERVCDAVFACAALEVEEAEGLPRGLLSRELALVALGRLGFGEMHPRSDLDLACFKRRRWVVPEEPERSARVEARFIRTLAGAFTSVTRHGALYDVDFRLRPYGDSSPHVQSREAVLAYFAGPAQLWERLAYLKARPLAGEVELGGEILRGVWSATYERGVSASDLSQVEELCSRLGAGARDLEAALKFWPGGLLHLDILLLVLQVKSRLAPGPGGTAALLSRLEAAGAVAPEQRLELFRARQVQEAILHRSRLHLERPPVLSRLDRELARLEAVWAASARRIDEEVRPKGLAAQWEARRQAVREIAGRLLGQFAS